METKTKITVPIMGKTINEVLSYSKEAIDSGANLLEFRIDYLNDYKIQDILDLIEDINFPMIATNRNINNRGYFSGTEEERINILNHVSPYVNYVDVEIELSNDSIDEISQNAKNIIVSFHDFEKTPSLHTMEKIVNKEMELCDIESGDLVKIATMPQSRKDALNTLCLLEKYNQVIAISMGDLGSFTRAISHKFNSPIVFASLNKKSAPGQISIEKMKWMHNNL